MREILAAIDLETTGLNPLKHDIIELAVVPLDRALKEDAALSPYVARIRATHPENADPAALAVNHLNPEDGADPADVVADFRQWMTDYGITKIIPLGHNVEFDIQFLHYRFPELMPHFTMSRAKDTMRLASVINDIAQTDSGMPFFPSMSLRNIMGVLGLEPENSHRALDDARETAQLYRAMLQRTSFAM